MRARSATAEARVAGCSVITCIVAREISYRVKRKVSGSGDRRRALGSKGVQTLIESRADTDSFFMFQHADGEERPWDVSRLVLRSFRRKTPARRRSPVPIVR